MTTTAATPTTMKSAGKLTRGGRDKLRKRKKKGAEWKKQCDMVWYSLPLRYQISDPDPNHQPKPISASPRGDALNKLNPQSVTPLRRSPKVQIVSHSAPRPVPTPVGVFARATSTPREYASPLPALPSSLTACTISLPPFVPTLTLHQSGNAPFEICISTVSVFPIRFSLLKKADRDKVRWPIPPLISSCDQTRSTNQNAQLNPTSAAPRGEEGALGGDSG